MKIEYSNNISLIDSLTEALKDDTIGSDERAQLQYMKKTRIENYIKEHHKNAISTYSAHGHITYTTRIKGQGKISAQTLEQLYEKLYVYYSGKSLKDNATFASIFKDALEWHSKENSNSHKTRIRNEKLYRSRIKGTDFEKMPLKEIRPHDIKAFMKSFTNKVGARELGNIKTLINFTFEYACEELEIISFNVASGVRIKNIKVLPGKRVGQLAYTQPEAKKIVSFLYNSLNVYHEAICFAFYVGLRFSEISDLKWSDLHDRVFTISHANTESGNLKNGECSVRQIYLCDEAYALLMRYKSERSDSEWIFPNRAGKPIYNNRLNEYLRKACDELGIEYRSIHKIRAYAITQIADSGGIETARTFAGHQTCGMTGYYVSGEMTDKKRNATESLNLGIQTSSDQFSGIKIPS